MAAVPSPAAAPEPRPPTRGAERPDLRVVAPPARRARWMAALVTVSALGVFAVVALHALAAEASLEARELEAEVAGLGAAREELGAEVAALESPERIREVATEELGMVRAEQPGYLVLDDTGRHLEDDRPLPLDDAELATAEEDEGGGLAERLVRLLTAGG